MARKLLTLLVFVVVAIGVSACGSSSSTDSTAPAGSAPAASEPNPCTASSLQTLESGKLTIGTDNPAFFPYFSGGPGHEWKGEFNNDPYAGEGFENAVAYAVAEQLGFTKDQVAWSVTPFNNSFKPGPKTFDFYLAQVSYSDQRAQNVDLSDSYYDVNQAVVSLDGKPIADATSIADLKSYKLGAQIGTTNFDFINSTIQPDSEPQVYNSTNDAISALKAGQIDGLVVDFPTAFYIANVQLDNGHLVGQFAASPDSPEHFSLVLAKDSPLTDCVNQALTTLRDDGTLAQLQQQWLSDIAEAPVLQ
jgi:polar amino acid transport system substrate-binding protein